MALRVALVGGPMYDGLYRLLEGRDVEVVVHASHPQVNRQVAALLEHRERIDVLSTHAKYAPQQSRWLRPLQDLVDQALIEPLAPTAVDRCRWNGELIRIPRNIDVRVLWARSDLVNAVPPTWDELLAGDRSFGFPGRASGLFGTFFELVTSMRGRLFTDDGDPCLVSDEAEWAVDALCRLARRCPPEQPEWHYDDVDAALGEGGVAMAAAWPGAYGPLRGAPMYDRLEPHPYFSGPGGWFSYSGCHAWAIPTTCADVDAAVALVSLLISEEAHRLEAEGGGVCSHRAVFDQVVPVDDTDSRRLEITKRTIDEAMITYPPLERFPAIEDAGWVAINEALRGEVDPAAAVRRIQTAAERILV